MDKQSLESGQSRCASCCRPLTKDEIALTRKLVNRGATVFFCLSCLAKHFEVPETVLHQKIHEFREMGCTLFEPSHKEP